MSFTVKVDPIDRDIELMLAEELGPDARSQALAAFAREQLGEAQAINTRALGAVPPHETFVDGRKGAAVESVRPDGTVVFVFDLVNDVLEWIGSELVKASPVLTGAYARSHILLADGVEVAVPGPIPLASVYTFMNVQPYSGKIERGQSPQATDGVYQAVAVVAKARFGNIAAVKFTYAYLATTMRGGDKAERQKRGADVGNSRVPAITVTSSGAL